MLKEKLLQSILDFRLMDTVTECNFGFEKVIQSKGARGRNQTNKLFVPFQDMDFVKSFMVRYESAQRGTKRLTSLRLLSELDILPTYLCDRGRYGFQLFYIDEKSVSEISIVRKDTQEA